LTNLLFIDWEGLATKEAFAEYISKFYPDKKFSEVVDAIKKYVKATA
jgi:hypothetical protein